MKITTQALGAILIMLAVVCAIVAYVHGGSNFGEMLHFAGDIVVGSFALLRGSDDKKPDDPDPKV